MEKEAERTTGGTRGSMWDELAVSGGREDLMKTWGVNKEELLVTPIQTHTHTDKNKASLSD